MSTTIGNLGTVATWIAGLTITGMHKTCDLTNLLEAVQPQHCPLLMPDVNAPFMTDLRVERKSGRVADGRLFQVTYRLHYILFHAPVAASGTSLFTAYSAMATQWSQIVTAIATNETPNGAYDIMPVGSPSFGVVNDLADPPVGFHGARFVLSVTEFD